MWRRTVSDGNDKSDKSILWRLHNLYCWKSAWPRSISNTMSFLAHFAPKPNEVAQLKFIHMGLSGEWWAQYWLFITWWKPSLYLPSWALILLSLAVVQPETNNRNNIECMHLRTLGGFLIYFTILYSLGVFCQGSYYFAPMLILIVSSLSYEFQRCAVYITAMTLIYHRLRAARISISPRQS